MSLRLCVFLIVPIQQYNFCTFWVSVADAFYQSLVAFFIPYLVNKSQTFMKTQYTHLVVSQVH